MKIADFVDVIAKGNVKEYVLNLLVPLQGLDRFQVILAKGMSISMSDVIGEKSWPQIYCSFELRHLIEHRNGKVDAIFKKRVMPHWRRSSWRDVPLDTGKSVEIRQGDFDNTFEAMVHAVDAIAQTLAGHKTTET